MGNAQSVEQGTSSRPGTGVLPSKDLSKYVVTLPDGGYTTTPEARFQLRTTIFDEGIDQSMAAKNRNASGAALRRTSEGRIDVDTLSKTLRLQPDQKVDLAGLAGMLQELKKTATTEELVLLHKALLPSTGLGEDATPLNSSTPPRETDTFEYRGDVIRRRSLFAPAPGTATRTTTQKLKKQPIPKAVRPQQAQHANTWSAEDFVSSPLSQLAGMNEQLSAKQPRPATPSDLECANLGTHKLGSLRIMNASPQPSIRSQRSPQRSQLGLNRQDDYFTYSEGTSGLSPGCMLTDDSKSTLSSDDMPATPSSYSQAPSYECQKSSHDRYLPSHTRPGTGSASHQILVHDAATGPFGLYLTEATSNPYLTASMASTDDLAESVGRSSPISRASPRNLSRAPTDANSLFPERSRPASPRLVVNRSRNEALQGLDGAQETRARPTPKSSPLPSYLKAAVDTASWGESAVPAQKEAEVSSPIVPVDQTKKPNKLQRKRAQSQRDLRESVVVQTPRVVDTVPSVPGNVASEFARRMSINPRMEHLEHTYDSVSACDRTSNAPEPAIAAPIRFPSPTRSPADSPASGRGRKTQRPNSGNGIFPQRLFRSSSRKTLRKKKSGEFRIDTSDEVIGVADFGSVADSLGTSPYDIASRDTRPRPSNEVTHPHQITSRRVRPVKSTVGMDEQAASQYAMRRSRDRLANLSNSPDSSQSDAERSFDITNDPWPGDDMPAEDVPPVPSIPKRRPKSRPRTLNGPLKSYTTSEDVSERSSWTLPESEDVKAVAPPVERAPSMDESQGIEQGVTKGWEAQAKLWRQRRKSIGEGLGRLPSSEVDKQTPAALPRIDTNPKIVKVVSGPYTGTPERASPQPLTFRPLSQSPTRKPLPERKPQPLPPQQAQWSAPSRPSPSMSDQLQRRSRQDFAITPTSKPAPASPLNLTPRLTPIPVLAKPFETSPRGTRRTPSPTVRERAVLFEHTTDAPSTPPQSKLQLQSPYMFDPKTGQAQTAAAKLSPYRVNAGVGAGCT